MSPVNNNNNSNSNNNGKSPRSRSKLQKGGRLHLRKKSEPVFSLDLVDQMFKMKDLNRIGAVQFNRKLSVPKQQHAKRISLKKV